MTASESDPLEGLDEAVALRRLVDGTATATGTRFFSALVENLAQVLHTHGAWVTEYLPESRRLRALAFRLGDEWVENYETPIDGTPCARVIDETRLVHIKDGLLDLYPEDPDIKQVGATSYLGMPLLDLDGRVLGHLAVMDRRPLPADPRAEALFKIFAARAAAELQRLRAEQELREREERLSRLIASAMDAIVELDEALRVTLMNPAAEKVFCCTAGQVVAKPFSRFLTSDSFEKLGRLARDLDRRPRGERYLWIPGGLQARPDGSEEPFSAEATLSRFEVNRRAYYTLILRNVNERLEAERRIRSLTRETAYLKEELRELHGLGEILGRSPRLLRVLGEVKQVADTGATVLIGGETGTGKELVARAIHGAGRRKDKALVRVNCAAIPGTLIESEFFGHAKGAFTGATERREGRFALADGGTIFLDEIGELPLALQAKLLRVLQEGEFEPVGATQTRKVDVRVIAATNRDLESEVKEGRFREDLFYRLNVFPIRVPPLRERGEDIPLLAEAFARRYARQLGQSLQPFTDEDAELLKSYRWPGNVRELQNVIERAVILAKGGRLELARALPEGAAPRLLARAVGGPADAPEAIRTVDEIQAFERANLIRALEATQWRVSGEGGAAQLLGMKPSTLASRMKALCIERPE